MSKSLWIVTVYAVLLLVGGIMGFIKAGSMLSLITGIGSAALVVTGVFLARKEKKGGYFLLLSVTALLVLFFGYRFLVTGAWMPAGGMLILSIGVLSLLLCTNCKIACCRQSPDQ